jgi:predicted metal-dependent hydrolase
MAPMTLVDYVIAHEACHVLEHNHSRRFWRSLETIMPDYENRVRELDRLGHLFLW